MMHCVFYCMKTYPHKLLTGRRDIVQMHSETNNVSGSSESIFDPIGTGHGCNSISAGLGMVHFLIYYCIYQIFFQVYEV